MYSLEPVDTIHHCTAKLTFVLDFFSQPSKGTVTISEEGELGLVLILTDIEAGLLAAADKIETMVRSLTNQGGVE